MRCFFLFLFLVARAGHDSLFPLQSAILFPAIKYKSVPLAPGEVDESGLGDKPSSEDFIDVGSGGDTAASTSTSYSPATHKSVQVHRFLVISRERFIVLDSNGEGVGSRATVKSNHHLTEV